MHWKIQAAATVLKVQKPPIVMSAVTLNGTDQSLL